MHEYVCCLRCASCFVSSTAAFFTISRMTPHPSSSNRSSTPSSSSHYCSRSRCGAPSSNVSCCGRRSVVLFSGKLLLVLGAGLLLRGLLLLFLLQSSPGRRAAAGSSPAVEALLAPAAASFSSFQEALTRYSLHMSPYSDGAYAQQPLIFFALRYLTTSEDDENCDSSSCISRYFMLLSLLDFIIAVSLAIVTAQARAWTAAWGLQDQQQRQQQEVWKIQQEEQQQQEEEEEKKKQLEVSVEKNNSQTDSAMQKQQQQLHRRIICSTRDQQQQQEGLTAAELVKEVSSSSSNADSIPTKDKKKTKKKKKKEETSATILGENNNDLSSSTSVSTFTEGAVSSTSQRCEENLIIASPALVTACFFLQPLTLATLLALSLHALPLAVFAASFAAASKAETLLSRVLCVLLYGLLLYVGPPQGLLLALPLALLVRSVRTGTVYSKSLHEVLPSVREELLPAFLSGIVMLLAGLIICCCLHFASFYAMGGPQDSSAALYFEETVVAVWGARDMSPNLGIFWYTFALVFARYRSLFAILLQGHTFLALLPLAVRFYRHPLSLCIAVASMALLFQPSFCASDSAFIIALLSSRQQVVRQSSSFVKLMVISLLSATIYPVMVELWLGRNTGNANFVYTLQLVHIISISFLLVQWVRRIKCKEEFTGVYRKTTESSIVAAARERQGGNTKCWLKTSSACAAST